MSRNLEYYVAQLDQWPFEVGVNLGLEPSAQKSELPFRAHIRLELNHPTDDGLCTKEEEALLLAVQEEILATLSPENHCFVASVTHRNARTLVVYLRDEPDENAEINKVMEKVETHASKVMWESDPEWAEYTDHLFPSENFLHQIKDRRLLKEFDRRGDDCSEIHNIEPRFMMKSKEAAEALSSSLAESGFAVKEINKLEGDDSFSWCLIASAQSPLALAVLDEFRPIWIELATKADAKFDGWSAEVVPLDGGHDNTGCDGHLSGKAEDYEGAVKPD